MSHLFTIDVGLIPLDPWQDLPQLSDLQLKFLQKTVTELALQFQTELPFVPNAKYVVKFCTPSEELEKAVAAGIENATSGQR